MPKLNPVENTFLNSISTIKRQYNIGQKNAQEASQEITLAVETYINASGFDGTKVISLLGQLIDVSFVQQRNHLKADTYYDFESLIRGGLPKDLQNQVESKLTQIDIAVFHLFAAKSNPVSPKVFYIPNPLDQGSIPQVSTSYPIQPYPPVPAYGERETTMPYTQTPMPVAPPMTTGSIVETLTQEQQAKELLYKKRQDAIARMQTQTRQDNIMAENQRIDKNIGLEQERQLRDVQDGAMLHRVDNQHAEEDVQLDHEEKQQVQSGFFQDAAARRSEKGQSLAERRAALRQSQQARNVTNKTASKFSQI